jgi:hypothetical protein
MAWLGAALAAGLLAVASSSTVAGPIILEGITFDDRLGGVVLHEGRGTGSLDDPFVLVEDITDDGPAVLTITGLRGDFANRVGTQHLVGFALTKIVRNRTERVWEVFELEVRERLSRASPYEDGLSFAQDAAVPELMGSDRYTSAYKTDEPLDSVVFSGAAIAPGETVTVRVVITDYSPNWQFYLLQRRNAPVAALGGGAAH